MTNPNKWLGLYFGTNLTPLAVMSQEIWMDLNSTNEQMKHGIGCLRFAEWYPRNCRGKSIHVVCNFASADLPKLSLNNVKGCLLFNKFNLGVDAVAPTVHFYNVFIRSIENLALTPDFKLRVHELLSKFVQASSSIVVDQKH